MKKSDLSFLVIGAGAVGGITAAFMRKNGVDVEILCKSEEYARLISEKGLRIKGAQGSFSERIHAYPGVKSISGKKDIILLATKASDLVAAAKSSINVLKKNGFFVSMQNGLCEEDLASVAGADRVIGCVTGWGGTMESEGIMDMTSTGDFIIGYPRKEPDEYLQAVAESLSAVVPVRLTDNIVGHKYSKLIINSCITSLGAICGLYLGKMLAKKKIRRIFIEIIREAIALSDKMNIRVEIFGGKLNFNEFIKGTTFFAEFKRHLMIRIIGFKYRRLKSSSLQSLERGKPTEVDYLNGYIVINARANGIKVPVNEAVVNIIHEIEAKKRFISVDNFNDPVFNRFN